MNTGRVVLIVTCLLVAALGVWLVIVRWEAGDKIATSVSALAAVAAVGVAVWAALRASRAGTSLVASHTGKATSKTDKANTGVFVKANMNGSKKAIRTGEADSESDANTGVQQDRYASGVKDRFSELGGRISGRSDDSHKASHTGDASAQGFANTGVHIGDINFNTASGGQSGGYVSAARLVEFVHIGMPDRTVPRWAEFPHRPEFLECEFAGGCDRLFHLKDFVYCADLFFDLVLLNSGDSPVVLSKVGVQIEAVQQLIYLYGYPEATKIKPAADEYEILMPDLRQNYDVGLMDHMSPDAVDMHVAHTLIDPVYLPAHAPYRYILHLREYQQNIPNHARIRLTAEVSGQTVRSPKLHIFTW